MSKTKLALAFGSLMLLFCPGLSFAQPQVCPEDDCAMTQTFTDLEPTQPRRDEVRARRVNLDSSFAPPGPPVRPGPAAAVDSHFWEHVEAFSTQSLQAFNTAAVGPGEEGRWLGPDEGVPPTGDDGSGNVAIHAALLRTGVTPNPTDSGAEILWFAGDVNDDTANAKLDVDHTGIFKVVNPSLPIAEQFKVEKVDSPKRRNPPPGKSRIVDLFCSGHALLGDGLLLVAGGTDDTPPGTGVHLAPPLNHYTAIRDTFIFDPKTNAWSTAGQMIPQPGRRVGGGRWYPSLLTLSSGRVAAFWGHPADDDTRHINDTPEIFIPEILRLRPEFREFLLGWELLGTEDDLPKINAFGVVSIGYPRVHLLPNGRVFRASPVPDGDSTKNVEINPIPGPNFNVKVSSGPEEGYNVTGDTSNSSVLLPLIPAEGYRARVLLVGGGIKQVGPRDFPIVVLQPQLIDIETNTNTLFPPKWRETKPRDKGIRDRARVHANATILPTGEIFVSGGLSEMGFVLEGEIYNPFETPRGPRGSAAGGSWRTVAAAKVGREYHSVALLMPDGRVWHAGTGSGVANVQESVDIYEPWYYTETRPIIQSMTGPEDPVYPGARVMHLHDSGVTVIVHHFRSSIPKFALVRAGSATHAFNYDQRYVEVQSELLKRTVERMNPVTDPVTGIDFRFTDFQYTFRLTSPPSSNIAPPGNYLLFAIDDRGVPSVGRFIRIDREFVGELKQEAEQPTRGPTIKQTVGFGCLREAFRFGGQFEYGGIDFGTRTGVVKQFSARVCTGERETIDVRLDRPDGPQIATLLLSPTGEFVEQTTSVLPVEGVHNVFIGPSRGTRSLAVDWFKFKQ